MNRNDPPGPGQQYTQGFWYGVFSAIMYCFSAIICMVNMLGYFLGHYPQHFALTDNQRTLILQTTLFCIWIAGGAAIFTAVEGWSFCDCLYFCIVTTLTIGFGDFYASTDVGRGLVFPFSIGGTIMLGLMVGSITRFAKELSDEKFVRGHAEKIRVHTIGRSVSASTDIKRLSMERRRISIGSRPIILHDISESDAEPRQTAIQFHSETNNAPGSQGGTGDSRPGMRRRMTMTDIVTGPVGALRKVTSRKPRLLVLREEKDRFDAMREIQRETKLFKRYYNLGASVFAFGLLWCVGAVVFYYCERDIQGISYFQALYLG
jgi:potassium channel subfamily K